MAASHQPSKEIENDTDPWFQKTVAARVQSDSAFAWALRGEAIMLFVNGEPESAKLIWRDLVNTTLGLDKRLH